MHTQSPARDIVNRAAVRLARGDIGEAERLYREAIALDTSNPTAYANLGYVLALSDRHLESMEASETAISLDPTRSAPWAHLGMSQLASGDIDDGLSSLSRAVRLDSGNHFAWNAMGRALFALGRAHEAELAWASALASRGDDADLLISLAAALGAQNRFEEAVRVLYRATTVAPDSSRAWAQLGVSSIVNLDFGTARSALGTALAITPDDEAVRFRLALLDALTGAVDDAQEALERLASEGGSVADEASALLVRLAPDPGTPSADVI